MADLIRDERSFPLGSIERAEVELEITTGPLHVRGGATEFCEAVFEYSHPELKPEAMFDADGGEAELEVRQPRTEIRESTTNRWDLAFNSGAAIDLAVASASGSVDLDLRDMRVSGVEVDSSSGKVDVRLEGDYPELDEVIIESASGSVDADLRGSFPALERLEVDSISGRSRISVSGTCPGLNRIAVESKSGTVDIDLGQAEFQRDDIGVRVEAISGNITVTIPSNTGVSLQTSVVSGRIQASDFKQSDGGRLVNAAFGSSTAKLWLNLRAISGNITVLTG